MDRTKVRTVTAGRRTILAAAAALVAGAASFAFAASAAAQTPGVPPAPIQGVGRRPGLPRRTGGAEPDRGRPGPAAPPVHGAERPLEPAQRRLPDRLLPGLGPAGRRDEDLDVLRARVRLDRLRLPGRIVTVCVGLDRPVLAVLDPVSLATLAALPLPVRSVQGTSNPFTDFSGGGYFFLDHRDRAVVSTNDRQVIEVAVGADASLSQTRAYDVSGAVGGRRRDHLGAARLERAPVVRDPQRHGRDDRSRGGDGSLAEAGGGDLELVRGRRDRRRVHRLRQGALPLRRRARRPARR